MNNLLSILIPTYNQTDTFEKIVTLYSNKSKVKIIVSDDSDDLKIKEKIKAICLEKNLSYFKGPQTSAINNWNFLLTLVETPFFVLNHHDDYPNNLYFLDYLDNIDPDKTGLVLLPCTSYICNKPHVRVSSRHQKIHIALFRFFPNPMFNIFLAPTASVIINSKLKLKVEDRDELALVALDSRSRAIDPTLELTIRKADFKVNLIKLSSQSFIATIREKLMWGKDKRN